MADEKKPAADWQELTKLTQGQPIVVERVRLVARDTPLPAFDVHGPLLLLPRRTVIERVRESPRTQLITSAHAV